MSDWIVEEIRSHLLDFVQADDRTFYEDDLHDLLHAIGGEVLNHDRKALAYTLLNDSLMVSELGSFLDELQDWIRIVDEIRTQWLYDHSANELPEEHLSVFGFTSEVVFALGRIKKHAQRILLLINRSQPRKNDKIDDLISRADLLKFEGIDSSTLNYRIKEMGHPRPAKTSGRKQWFDATQVDAWLHGQPRS